MPTHKSEDYKLSAVEYYLTEDKTQEEVCKIFKCSARSWLRWVDKYKENANFVPSRYVFDWRAPDKRTFLAQVILKVIHRNGGKVLTWILKDYIAGHRESLTSGTGL